MPLTQYDQLPVVWEPDEKAFAGTPLGRMAHRHDLPDAISVHRRAVQDPNWYWKAAAEDLGLRWFRSYDSVLDVSGGIEFPRFFAGGTLNWSDYAVDRWVDEGHGTRRAVNWEGDSGDVRELTYSELKDQISRAAGALGQSGVGEGDTVAIALPMIPEAVISVLAVARIGGIAVPMFSGFGSAAMRARLLASRADVVITCDSFHRRGKAVRIKDTIDEAVEGLGVRCVLVVRHTGDPIVMNRDRDLWWDGALSSAPPVQTAVAMDSDAPCLLLFTSGTTAEPKGCVHTHAGLPFKLAIEARHSLGLDNDGALLWVTDMGWIMGIYLVAASLANGATACLFEGTPDWPTPARLWDVVANAGVTVLGLAPTVIRALMRYGESWPEGAKLDRLSAIGSTGELWSEDAWMWCYRHVCRERVPIVNLCGGTECGGTLVSGSTVLPAKPMSFSGPTLGVATDIVDERGNPVRGQAGELVVRAPWPGMTKSLWSSDEQYLAAYWRRYSGMWHQGDLAYVDGDGYWFVLGRSDDTMNIAGKRVGPAEVESTVLKNDEVMEAAAVGVPDEVKGEALVVFVVLRQGVTLGELEDQLAAQMRRDLGPTMSAKFVDVSELPKTRTGKVLRRVLRASYIGAEPGDLSSLENPSSLLSLPSAPQEKR